MATAERDAIAAHRDRAEAIQHFMWEGKPHKSPKRTHTVEELEAFLEDLRLGCWRDFDDAKDGYGF